MEAIPKGNPEAYRIDISDAGSEGVNGSYKYLDYGGTGEGEFVRQDADGFVYNIQKNKSSWFINRCNAKGVIVMYMSSDSNNLPWLPPSEGWRFAEAAKLPAPTVSCLLASTPEPNAAPVKAAPAKAAPSKTPAELVAGSPKWYELRDPEVGRISYLNLDTGESVFERPKDFDAGMQKAWEGQVKKQSPEELNFTVEPVAQSAEEKKAESVKKAEAMKEAGNASFREKHFAQALAQYTEAIILSPRNVTYRCNRAACLLQLQQWSRAEADAKECVRLDPKQIKGHVRLLKARMGLLEQQQGNVKLATVIKTLKAGLAIEPKSKDLVKLAREVKALKAAADKAKADLEARKKSVAEEVRRRVEEREAAELAKETAVVEAKASAENARRAGLRSLIEGRRRTGSTDEKQMTVATKHKPVLGGSVGLNGDVVHAELPWATEALVSPTEVGATGDGSGAGLTVNVADGVEAEDVLLRIPLEHTLHPLMLHPAMSRSAQSKVAVVVEMQPAGGGGSKPRDVAAVAEFSDLVQRKLSENEKLLLLLLLERSKGDASSHYEQILRMPLTYDLPVCWEAAELDELKGSSWLAVINKLRAQTLIDHIEFAKKLGEIVGTGVASPTLRALEESLRIVTKDGSTGGSLEQNIDVEAHVESESWRLYLWAYCVLSSRATDLTVDFLPRGYTFDGDSQGGGSVGGADGEGRLRLLVPGFDLFNHDPALAQTERAGPENALAEGQQTHFWNAADGTVCVRATKSYSEGEEAHISYGARSNGHLLLWYGFTLEENPHDCVLLYLTLERSPQQQAQEEESGITDIGAEEENFRAKRRAMVAGGLRAYTPQAAGAGGQENAEDKGPKSAWEDPEGVLDDRLEDGLWGTGDFVVEHKLKLGKIRSNGCLSFGGKKEEVRVAAEGVDSMLHMMRILSLGEKQVRAMTRLRSKQKRGVLRAQKADRAKAKAGVSSGFLDKRTKKGKKAEADAAEEKSECGMEYGGQRPISLGHEQALLAELRSMVGSMLAQYPASLAEDEAELKQLAAEAARAAEGVDGMDATARRRLLSVRLRMGEKRTYEAVLEELDRRQEEALENLPDDDAGDY
jgi:tetratricopeptide (TPR) repeat protein